jgi:omega-6 fatty acid desaturase (delta-12 desaturase)
MAGALWLAFLSSYVAWLMAQLLFAIVFLQWFILLHEAGHHTFFKTRYLNTCLGYCAGFFALIPFTSWQRIHTAHHRWTGWQDLDATTAELVPRIRPQWQIILVRLAWRTHMPFFSIIYRVTNYWHISRIKRFVTIADSTPMLLNIVIQLIVYALLCWYIGFIALAKVCGIGLLLSLALQDILLLSQHTHIPQRHSLGKNVRPFSHKEQAQFTRTLRFPGWFSRLILNFDKHELHHKYVHIPGYDLHKIDEPSEHTIDWWRWLVEAKRLPGDVFLFQTEEQTGVHI